ncbi:hypothetical protein NDU88_000930 [Pleurodeles waltl]|uniref:Uncharacterized protein n=1 Tax=Pleurodeles waltl TaxID=8319 RepID=A0AAV7U4X0_PLEWA|nr:hypothetical protein NDU88_000930 [Pleurodeles waltl]
MKVLNRKGFLMTGDDIPRRCLQGDRENKRNGNIGFSARTCFFIPGGSSGGALTCRQRSCQVHCSLIELLLSSALMKFAYTLGDFCEEFLWFPRIIGCQP